MLRRFRRAFIFAAALVAARAAADPPVKLPPGTRAEGDHYVSGRGLRDATELLAKELAGRGIPVSQIGPYAVRGVELTRFVSGRADTSWLAIHVVRIAGKTLIFFVDRPAPLTKAGSPVR